MTLRSDCVRLAALVAAATMAVALLMPAAVSASTDPNIPWIIYDGHTGDAVECIQFILSVCAAHPVTHDGIYGPETRQGVLDMQKFFGLQMDGIVGPETGEAFKVVGINCFVPLVGQLWSALSCQAVVPTKT